VSKMAVARVETLTTRSAPSCLVGYAHVRVHGPVGGKGARVVGGGDEVVYIAI
jgi:hypothetical protein